MPRRMPRGSAFNSSTSTSCERRDPSVVLAQPARPPRHVSAPPASRTPRSSRKTAVIRTSPQGRSREIGRYGRLNQNGFRAVFGVIGKHTSSRCRTDWYRVQLPVLPNGKTGWVRAWAVQPFRVRSRITVDLSQRRLRVYRSGKVVVDTRVAVGTTATPTPPGRYFVNERYVLPDAAARSAPAHSGSRRTQTCFSMCGSRTARSASTARTSLGRSAARPRTAASASRTAKCAGSSDSLRPALL